jgi:hypothetical protein
MITGVHEPDVESYEGPKGRGKGTAEGPVKD